MRLIALVCCLFSFPALSALDMKTGLWSVKMVMKTDGKEMNIPAGMQEKMQEALKKMPEDKKKKMMEMMGGVMPQLGQNNEIKICHTKETLAQAEKMGQDHAKKCQTKIITKNTKKLETEFNCEDGTKGTAVWTAHSQEKYEGLVKMTNSAGKKSEINYNASFVSTECGSVKAN